MRAIKHALTERYYTWQDAVDVAMSDPEIDMQAKDGQVYKPGAYEEDLDDAHESRTEASMETIAEVEAETVKPGKELSR
jgi:large subunit ribosomal protein L47